MPNESSPRPAPAKMTALALVAAFLLAAIFSSAPQWHEYFHGGAEHQCAVTLMMAGNCDGLVPAVPNVCPHFQVVRPVFVTERSRPVSAALDFSRLEHAPPSFS